MNDQACKHILIAHAIIGYDTVSAIYNAGEKKALALLQSSDWRILDAFLKSDGTHAEVEKSDKLFILKHYNGKQSSTFDMF